MRFTAEQYDEAIADLFDAKTQLEPNGHGCHVCGDSGHMAWECGSNPLFAMVLCAAVAKRAGELHDKLHELEDRLDHENVAPLLADWREDAHEFMHWLSGCCMWRGEPVGPAKMRAPKEDDRG